MPSTHSPTVSSLTLDSLALLYQPDNQAYRCNGEMVETLVSWQIPPTQRSSLIEVGGIFAPQ
jgi:hypothetical protein